jgi:BirA family transcriptional regulator, biotin operon repressor / biotin---[acetyl-CoA-carboxylase] ligase
VVARAGGTGRGLTRQRALAPLSGPNPLGGPVVHLDLTGSTNDHARTLAQAGAPHGTVVLAEEQTAGRGRQGRAWHAPRGRSLTLSIVVRAERPALELLPLASAVAVCEACEQVAAVRCTVKWPNDVWVDGRKLAGILIEGRPLEGWAALGIGLNADTPAEELEPELRASATSLRIAAGRSVERERVLDALLDALASRLRDSAKERGSVLTSLRERDALYGRTIAWSAGEERFEGEARGIDDEGRLIVFEDTGERRALDAGEVHVVGL